VFDLVEQGSLSSASRRIVPMTAFARSRRSINRGSARSGQGIVEFALASTIFLMIVLGTIDFGRAIFLAAELRNAVREGTAVGRVQPANTTAIRSAVVNHGTGNGIPSGNVTVSCTGSCSTGGTITVSASIGFQAVTQSLLGIAPITMSASSTVDIE
jgi:Flp pilus assembly protein TadG